MGIAASAFDLFSALAFCVLAYLYLPIYRRAGVITLPEYTELRFSKAVRRYLAVLACVVYITTKVSVSLYCGAVLLAAAADVPQLPAVGALLLITGLFTIAGGLKAVIYVEMCNTAVLLAGGLATCGIALARVGGLSGLQQLVSDSQPGSAAAMAGITPSFAHLYTHTGPYSFLGLLMGGPFMILWFHCADQEMVQRGLCARSAADAKAACISGGLLKLTVPFMFCLPGIVARLLYPLELGCTLQAAGQECTGANLAFPVLLQRLLPAGLRGLVLAGGVAGVVSVLSSTFNSAATLVTMDLYREWAMKTTARAAVWARPRQLVWVGRLCIAILTGLALAWLPLLPRLSPSLYIAMQSMNAYVAPPVIVVYTAGVLWPGCTAAGALAGLLVGHAAGALRLILQLTVDDSSVTMHNALVASVVQSRFLYFAAAVGCISTAVTVLVSLRSAAAPLRAVAPFVSRTALRLAALLHDWQQQRRQAAQYDTGQPLPHDTRHAEYLRAIRTVEERAARCGDCGGVVRLQQAEDAAAAAVAASAPVMAPLPVLPVPSAPSAPSAAADAEAAALHSSSYRSYRSYASFAGRARSASRMGLVAAVTLHGAQTLLYPDVSPRALDDFDEYSLSPLPPPVVVTTAATGRGSGNSSSYFPVPTRDVDEEEEGEEEEDAAAQAQGPNQQQAVPVAAAVAAAPHQSTTVTTGAGADAERYHLLSSPGSTAAASPSPAADATAAPEPAARELLRQYHCEECKAAVLRWRLLSRAANGGAAVLVAITATLVWLLW